MKLSTTSFFSTIAVLGLIACVSSCSKTDNLPGSWQGNSERLTNIHGVSQASSTVNLDFSAIDENTGQGRLDLMAVVEISQPIAANSGAITVPYVTNITATATATATYVYEEDSDDDILVSIDPASFQVNIDPDAVTFSENMTNGTEKAILDSLSTVTADKWRVIIAGAVRDQFNKYRKIEDIKVHHSDLMSCEVEDRDLTFRRVGLPE